jgi:drug/metabolite transporter (DMT)-like permease
VALVAHALLRHNALPARPGDPRRMLLRCVVGLLAMLCFFWSIDHLPLGTATALQYTAPLLTVALAGPLLGERLDRRGWLAVIVAFAGVLLMLRPSLRVDPAALLVGLTGAALAAWVYVIVRQLRATDPPTRIVWWFAVVGAALTLPLAALEAWPATPRQWALAVAVGVGATGGQFGITQAYRLERATLVGPLSYATVLLSALAGAALFDERLGAASLFGLALFLGAGGWLAARPREAPVPARSPCGS